MQEHKKIKKKSKSSKDRKVKEKKADNASADLWLIDETCAEKGKSSIGEYTEVFGDKDLESHKSSKHKKSKSSEKSKKDFDQDSKVRVKKAKSKKDKKSLGYEETAGISTPSKEILPNSDNDHNGPITLARSLYSSQKELAKDKTVTIMYDIKQFPHETDKLLVSLEVSNVSDNLLKELIVDVTETSTLRVVRNVSFQIFFFLRHQLNDCKT